MRRFAASVGRWLRADPRRPQLIILSSLLVFGAAFRGFLPTPWALPAAFAGGWSVAALTRGERRGWDPFLSASISCLSTLLLFRAPHAWSYAAVAGLAIASKRLLRIDGRHFINPTNGAILFGATFLGGWVGSGQWGHDLVLVFALAGGAAVTLTGAARVDTAAAFLLGTLGFVALRNAAFGYDPDTLLHSFTSGSLWVFALYMITDPKTTPRAARHRVLHALAVAGLAVALRQFWFVRHSFLWALLACAPLVPLLDLIGRRAPNNPAPRERNPMSHKNKTAAVGAATIVLFASTSAHAFCGFFAGKAGAQLFNQASQVVIVHHDDKTVLTMVNDFKGPAEDFALVVPVPVVLQEDVVRVAQMGPIDHLDSFTAPRLAEYHDPNPCQPPVVYKNRRSMPMASMAEAEDAIGAARPKEEVRVEASFSVGEYDIVILSSEESNALERWLRRNGYNIPAGASRALRPYVTSGMKFFVAKVAVDRLDGTDEATKLNPLQFAFPDRRFMLPVRLGMLNSKGFQDLVAYVITPEHRAEVTNYRNVRLPTNVNVPTFVKEDFAEVYRAVFRQAHAKTPRAVFTEYGWNMGWCDPCASPPLSRQELEQLGVWWLDRGRGTQAYVTRLHARYSEETFPEDLVLQTTRDTSNFQVRLVMNHPYTAKVQCSEADAYFGRVLDRRAQEADALADLTGWSRKQVLERMHPLPPHFTASKAGGSGSYLDRVRSLFTRPFD